MKGYARECESTPTAIVGYSISELPSALNAMERSLQLGEKATLELATEALPTDEDLENFYLDMLTAGFHVSKPVAKIVEGIPVTKMVLQKGSPQWALLIPMIPTILIVGLITFGIAKLEEISRALLPLILATGGLVVIALGIMRTEAKEVAKKYIERR